MKFVEDFEKTVSGTMECALQPTEETEKDELALFNEVRGTIDESHADTDVTIQETPSLLSSPFTQPMSPLNIMDSPGMPSPTPTLVSSTPTSIKTKVELSSWSSSRTPGSKLQCDHIAEFHEATQVDQHQAQCEAEQAHIERLAQIEYRKEKAQGKNEIKHLKLEIQLAELKRQSLPPASHSNTSSSQYPAMSPAHFPNNSIFQFESHHDDAALTQENQLGLNLQGVGSLMNYDNLGCNFDTLFSRKE